jgi:hypothetical protein
LSRLTEERATIDFAFIDGQHTFDYVLVDFFLIDKLLRPGGIVILDDLSYPSIRSVCRYILTNLRYKCVGPQTQELPELAAGRRFVSRVRQNGISWLLNAPLRRFLVPAWQMFEWRLVAPKSTLLDSQLNLPEYSNYVALEKLENDLIGEGHHVTRHWTHHIPF